MEKTKLIIGIVIAALLLISVVQIFQIGSARAEIKQDSYSGQQAPSSGYEGGGVAPSTQNSYPSMVGGC